MSNFTKTTLLVLLGMTLLTNSFAQSTPQEITGKFFSVYEKEPLKALEYVFSTNQWFAKNPDDVANVKTKLQTAIDLCGQYFSYELASEKAVGQSVKLITYLVKYDRQPLRFQFLMYKPKDVWRVNNFTFDVNVAAELELTAKDSKQK